jgi:2-hydroxy-3-keto-5-methylthiopentenyl-1-phosphate phosphatase
MTKVRKIIILDLDGTLVHSTEKCDIPCTYKNGHILLRNNSRLHLRPYYKDFLSWCNEQTYEIIIYSAAYETYVNDVVALLFKDLDFKPVAIFDSSSLRGPTYNKTVSDIITNDENSVIVIIDDDCDNYKNDRKKLILIKEWTIDLRKAELDRELLLIQNDIFNLMKLEK